jgi:hypothetical protein
VTLRSKTVIGLACSCYMVKKFQSPNPKDPMRAATWALSKEGPPLSPARGWQRVWDRLFLHLTSNHPPPPNTHFPFPLLHLHLLSAHLPRTSFSLLITPSFTVGLSFARPL